MPHAASFYIVPKTDGGQRTLHKAMGRRGETFKSPIESQSHAANPPGWELLLGLQITAERRTRALDTTSPLPLFDSLTQLVYLTSTSPRIREIITMEENPAMLYGLSPPSARPNKLVPTLNPPSLDKHAAYIFAFQG
ncbi:hypothetical protein PLEOSDRAFT_1105191 [Pleurotus ostreatus PC15]|uniref:Uncharacterized protein n=1 Tax=Pleurotus ostreatus (strain PC15) TaxID=1137138 RepID=A0A067NH32_PLEO1|nr:hypothetical protein PLEOSDRAFT_1105191 [Pleurotus ostreatus PC15]